MSTTAASRVYRVFTRLGAVLFVLASLFSLLVGAGPYCLVYGAVVFALTFAVGWIVAAAVGD